MNAMVKVRAALTLLPKMTSKAGEQDLTQVH